MNMCVFDECGFKVSTPPTNLLDWQWDRRHSMLLWSQWFRPSDPRNSFNQLGLYLQTAVIWISQRQKNLLPHCWTLNFFWILCQFMTFQLLSGNIHCCLCLWCAHTQTDRRTQLSVTLQNRKFPFYCIQLSGTINDIVSDKKRCSVAYRAIFFRKCHIKFDLFTLHFMNKQTNLFIALVFLTVFMFRQTFCQFLILSLKMKYFIQTVSYPLKWQTVVGKYCMIDDGTLRNIPI